ncbi:uncharacterized protein LOC135848887 [Planococcus citri]|uniref:uncharacterized protein LOC135848887 n=1 Tax=Planococcus citri TaxID=170843 RepID=UPI0031F942CA
MNEIAFANLIVKVVQSEVKGRYVDSGLDPDCCYWVYEHFGGCGRDLDNFLQLCFEIWNTAAENLKRSAIRDITSNNELFEDIIDLRCDVFSSTSSRELKFLLAVLTQATYEQRNAFWHNFYQELIRSTSTESEDFQTIMKLSLRDEDEISEFKKNIMANDEYTIHFCRMLLIRACFDELNQFVRFLLPEIQAARNFKQRLLESTYSGDRRWHFNEEFIQKPEEFDEFISGAYSDVELSTNFKNQLMSSPSIRNEISECALFVPIEQFFEFIDLFVSNEEILLQVKTHVIDYLKKNAAIHEPRVPKSQFISVLSWCLEDKEQVPEFILTYVRKV